MTDEQIEAAARAMQRANRPTNGMMNADQIEAMEAETLHAYCILARAALEAAERVAWRPIESAPKGDGQSDYGPRLLLRLSGLWAGEIVHARWYHPWGVWHRVGEEAHSQDDEMFGIGSEIPDGWMPEGPQ